MNQGALEDILCKLPAKQIMTEKENSSTRICVKVENLRKLYGPKATLEKWLEDPDNIYCGRAGRIFIDKEIFHYSGSKWANPYVVEVDENKRKKWNETHKNRKYSLEESLEKYQEYISENSEDLDELRGKNLGCWCDPKNKCHVDVLLSLLSLLEED